MSLRRERLRSNLAGVRERIERAALRAGRESRDIHLVVVTKYAPDEAVSDLASEGPCHLGESRPQQLIRRAETLSGVRWHLIGHLQRNKVRAVLPHVDLIHSVDSARLLHRIDEIAGELQLRTRVLLEVNVSGDAAKDGFDPDSLRQAWSSCCDAANVDIGGLMTMAPLQGGQEAARPVFRRLRELRDELQARSIARGRALSLPHLSMGMSGDYEVAIEEGATIVRIGSAIFEGIDAGTPPAA